MYLHTVTFNLNCGLHAVSVGKPPEWMSNFWTVRIFKNRIRTNFCFLHIPSLQHLTVSQQAISVVYYHMTGSVMCRLEWCYFYWYVSICIH